MFPDSGVDVSILPERARSNGDLDELVGTKFTSSSRVQLISMYRSIMIFGVVIVFFTIYYVTNARHRYTGPVVHVRKDL